MCVREGVMRQGCERGGERRKKKVHEEVNCNAFRLYSVKIGLLAVARKSCVLHCSVQKVS